MTRLDETQEIRETRSNNIPRAELEARGLPKRCFVTHPLECKPVMLVRGEMGYNEIIAFGGPVTADELNTALGVTPEQVEAMLHGSMFGFHTPGADPRFYTKKD